MEQKDYKKFTVIMRGYSLSQADKVINILKDYQDHFLVEITLNSENALELIDHLSQKYKGQIYIGAGTVTNLKEAQSAVAAGAEFLLSPIGFTKDMMTFCKKNGILAVAAALTPTEIVNQLDLGADIIKIFPAASIGARFFKDVQGPLGKLPLMAVGGVGVNNYQEFLENGCTYLGMGSAMFGDLDLDAATDEQLREIIESYIDN